MKWLEPTPTFDAVLSEDERTASVNCPTCGERHLQGNPGPSFGPLRLMAAKLFYKSKEDTMAILSDYAWCEENTPRRPRPKSVLKPLLENLQRACRLSLQEGGYPKAEYLRQEIAKKAASYLGYCGLVAQLEPVPAESGGGDFVWLVGLFRGPSGYIAHIDNSGWILRIKPYVGDQYELCYQFPQRDTPIEQLMERLIDDPLYPGKASAPNARSQESKYLAGFDDV